MKSTTVTEFGIMVSRPQIVHRMNVICSRLQHLCCFMFTA